ncbi:hypothetical protein BV25DRAFT_1838588 [Artomyces pyxidatus]|uniref:Uncharacterized protein n=1 Tax=Artomyces pyxidatus TaxID=48021 RepID=A0ACB8SZW7_9AGAM|nr:hypothetical protein BV25DRAFT_1838588 [Artomyces pyxidatus]
MPPVTRQKSGKVPRRKPVVADSEENSDSDGDSSHSYDDQEERSPTPTTKRRKTGKAGASSSPSKPAPKSKGPGRNLQGKLKVIFSMPLDIILEIFSHLLPMDLLSLARTSKDLRNLLMSRKMASMWKSARLLGPGPAVPDPPQRRVGASLVSAALGRFNLYSVSASTRIHYTSFTWLSKECGAKNKSYGIDFVLRRRVCSKCVKEKWIQLWTSHLASWYNGFRSQAGYYWRPDLYAISARLAALRSKPKELAVYRAARVQFVKSAQEVSWLIRPRKHATSNSSIETRSSYEDWEASVIRFQQEEAAERAEKRYREVRKRLLANGFKDVDIEIAYRDGTLSVRDAELTDLGWNRTRSKVEGLVKEARVERIERGHRTIVTRRTRKAEGLHHAALQKCLPVQWFYMPSADALRDLPCFKVLIEHAQTWDEDADLDLWTEEDVDLTVAMWDSAAAKLPQDVVEWMHSKRATYTALLPDNYNHHSVDMDAVLLSDPDIDAFRSERMSTYAGALELAVAVFSYDERTPLVGRDFCHSWKMTHRQARFSIHGHHAAVAVVDALGLPPQSTTATELDRLDRRFLCMCCARAENNVLGRLSVYSWKDCLYDTTSNTT